MLEVEVKYSVADFGPLEGALAKRGATLEAARRDADHYFCPPDRDFGKTDEALRLRSIGEYNFVTYKGPKIDKDTKTRLEIEVALADGAEAAADFGRILTHLRYKSVAVVKKTRRIASFARDGFKLQVSLDEVDGVGRYAEVEAVADESKYEAAKATVLAVAAEFGLTTVERRSYLQLLLERS